MHRGSAPLGYGPVAPQFVGNRIRKVDANGIITTIAGT
jgi:hypothetical protein